MSWAGRLTIVSGSGAIGYQPTPQVTDVATALAAQRTAQLAASAGSNTGAAILAAGAAPGPAGLKLGTQAGVGSEPAHLASLRAQMTKACFVDKSPAACSTYSQQLAAMEAARHCPGGDVYALREQVKRAGSIEHMLRNPTWVSAPTPASPDQSAVAITLSAQSPGLLSTNVV
jgi:hypothetical protein